MGSSTTTPVGTTRLSFRSLANDTLLVMLACSAALCGGLGLASYFPETILNFSWDDGTRWSELGKSTIPVVSCKNGIFSFMLEVRDPNPQAKDIIGWNSERNWLLSHVVEIDYWGRFDKYNVWVVELSMAIPATLFGAYPLLILVRTIQKQRLKRKLGVCHECGYDLRSLEIPRCPECGTEVKTQ